MTLTPLHYQSIAKIRKKKRTPKISLLGFSSRFSFRSAYDTEEKSENPRVVGRSVSIAPATGFCSLMLCQFKFIFFSIPRRPSQPSQSLYTDGYRFINRKMKNFSVPVFQRLFEGFQLLIHYLIRVHQRRLKILRFQ